MFLNDQFDHGGSGLDADTHRWRDNCDHHGSYRKKGDQAKRWLVEWRWYCNRWIDPGLFQSYAWALCLSGVASLSCFACCCMGVWGQDIQCNSLAFLVNEETT